MNLINESKFVFLDLYKRIPVNVSRGEGVWLYDNDDNPYLDLLAGIAVNALGYNHPAIKAALIEQANRNLHLSNFFVQDIQLNLARKLLSLTPFDKVFLSNSGAEAIECLLKIVKKWGRQNNKSKIISFSGSFHGRTLGAVSITGQEKYRKSFEPLIPGIEILPYNDVEIFEKTISETTSAIFFEGISGEGGIKKISPEMLEAIKKGREKYGYLIVADEIQTGVGRTGSFYYYENFTFVPDAIASAKGLGGGLPLGAALVNKKLSNILDMGEHGTTYGGNPLACATGLATINIVSEESFLNKVKQTGKYFKSKLQNISEKYSDNIIQLRGQGLMLGLEVKHSAQKIMDMAIEKKLLFNVAGAGTTLRFVPPLILENQHIDIAVQTLDDIFSQIFKVTNN